MKVRILYFIIILLLGSQIFFFIKDDYYDRIYIALFAKKTDPKKYPKYWLDRDKVFNNEFLDSNSIIFIGDSQTQLFMLNDFLRAEKIHNRGIIGDDIKGVSNRIGPILKTNPRKLFIMIGINDLLNQKRFKDLTSLVSIILAKKHNTEILFQSILPIGKNEHLSTLENHQINYDKINKNIIETNKFIESFCLKYNLKYINIHSAFHKNGTLQKDHLISDGIHLSKKGYLTWANSLKKYI